MQVTAHLDGAVGQWRLCGLFAWEGGELQLDACAEELHAFEFWSRSYQRIPAHQGPFIEFQSNFNRI